MSEEYITVGDRVVISPNRGLGASNLRPHDGKHGVVIKEDGYGYCKVRLDDGTEVYAWNIRDLEREDAPKTAEQSESPE